MVVVRFSCLGSMMAEATDMYVPGGEWLFLGWLIVVGACLGSFLNVVVHRLPLGLSVSYPPSRCPQCRHAIRGYDNVPVLSWLALHGQCRDCGLPISGRYPLVEFSVALISGLLASVDLFSTWWGMQLSASGLNPWTSAIPWMRFTGHLLLACTMLAAALMEYDRQRVPQRLYYPVLLVGFVALFLAPATTGWPLAREELHGDAWSRMFGELFLAVAAGTGLALLREGWNGLVGRGGDTARPASRFVLPLALASLAIWLGWRAALVVLATLLMAWLIHTLIMPRRADADWRATTASFPIHAALAALTVAYFLWNL